MIIDYKKTLLDAPAKVVNLVLAGDLEIRKAHDFTWPFLTGEESVVWAEIDNEPVGCQVWSLKDKGRIWWYEVSYVLPEHRGKGVLVEIRLRVRELAKVDGKVKFIESLVAVNNESMLKSMKKVGYEPANYHFRYPVGR